MSHAALGARPVAAPDGCHSMIEIELAGGRSLLAASCGSTTGILLAGSYTGLEKVCVAVRLEMSMGRGDGVYHELADTR